MNQSPSSQTSDLLTVRFPPTLIYTSWTFAASGLPLRAGNGTHAPRDEMVNLRQPRQMMAAGSPSEPISTATGTSFKSNRSTKASILIAAKR